MWPNYTKPVTFPQPCIWNFPPCQSGRFLRQALDLLRLRTCREAGRGDHVGRRQADLPQEPWAQEQPGTTGTFGVPRPPGQPLQEHPPGTDFVAPWGKEFDFSCLTFLIKIFPDNWNVLFSKHSTGVNFPDFPAGAWTERDINTLNIHLFSQDSGTANTRVTAGIFLPVGTWPLLSLSNLSSHWPSRLCAHLSKA